MFKIERITMTKRTDDDGELVPDFDSDFFVMFSKQGIPVFDYDFRAKEFDSKEDAEAVVAQLTSLFDNTKRRISRVYFQIEEVRAA